MGVRRPFISKQLSGNAPCTNPTWLLAIKSKTRVFFSTTASHRHQFSALPSAGRVDTRKISAGLCLHWPNRSSTAVCCVNMANRKRQHAEDSPPCKILQTPEKRVSEVRREQDADYMQWGVERTCQFLRTEGLQEWEDAFRGLFFSRGSPRSPVLNSTCHLISADY